MATLQLFNSLRETLPEKVHNLQADSLKWMLTNTAPTLANAVKTDLTDIAAGNGYTAGGTVVSVTSSAQTGGVYSLALAACVFTAAGGSFAPFRYIVIYNDTATNKELIGFLDYGTAYTLTTGLTFTIPAQTAFTLA